MSLRVVLYAEGARETGPRSNLAPAAGDRLTDDKLGPAHVLVRRCVAFRRKLPENAVIFEAPLRVGERIAEGSDFLRPTTLRQLFTWLGRNRKPDLAILLVDQDEQADRRRQLRECLSDMRVPRVIAVAVQEFEAWLIADETAAASVLNQPIATPPAPEGMRRREAKQLLRSWIGTSKDESLARLEIARVCNLPVIRSRCPAFAEFLSDLGAGPP